MIIPSPSSRANGSRHWAVVLLAVSVLAGAAAASVLVPACGSDDSPSSPSGGGGTVYVTESGSKYHKSSCSYLSSSKIAMSCDDAIDAGYTPCSRCKPSCD